MSDSKIERLLSEIAKLQPQVKRIVPYLNNEPFLDSRMIAVLRRIRGMLPTCEIELSTNASALTRDKARDLLAENLADDVRISFFAADPGQYSSIMPGLKYERVVSIIQNFISLHRQLASKTKFSICMVLMPGMDAQEQIRQLSALLLTDNIRVFGYLDRAGSNCVKNVTIFDPTRHRMAGCVLNRPIERLCILSDGSVITCSQDWARKNILGNVFSTSLAEVCQSPLRRLLIEKVQGQVASDEMFICKQCKLARLMDRESGYVQNFAGDEFLDPSDRKLITVSDILSPLA